MFFKHIFKALGHIAAPKELKKKVWIGSNGVEKQNEKENKRKHKARTAEFVKRK